MKRSFLMVFLGLAYLLSGCGSKTETPAVSPKAQAFHDDCATFAPAIPGFAPLCESLPKEKTPEQLATYDDTINTLIGDFKKWGPEVAKNLIAKCASKALVKASSPLDLQFCLETSHLNVESLAKGSSDAKAYAPLIGKVQQEPSPDPNAWSSLSEEQRTNLRRTAVDACATKAGGYVGAACAAVALHEELFASKPFGPNGEGAKVFDKAMELYKYANAPQDMAKKALEDIGIPSSILNTPEATTAAAAKAVSDTANAVNKGLSDTKNAVDKALGVSW